MDCGSGHDAEFALGGRPTEVSSKNADVIEHNVATGCTRRANDLLIVYGISLLVVNTIVGYRRSRPSGKASRIEDFFGLRSVLDARKHLMIEVNGPIDAELLYDFDSNVVRAEVRMVAA